jgi:hypothetical protein
LPDSSFVASIPWEVTFWISTVHQARRLFLDSHGIEELRFWNHQWRKNPDGVLLEIWQAVYRRTGCVQVKRKTENQRFVPPQPGQWKHRSP